ncbi:transposase [Clostridium perfringens]
MNQVLSISITSLKALFFPIKEVNKAITAQIELLLNVLISIPDISSVLSAGIMHETRDINRFGNYDQLAKYVGLAWKQHQSGYFEAQTTILINSDNCFLKYYLCEAAFSIVRCDKEYSNFYRPKYKELNRYQHKRAIALTARKFVQLFLVLLKDNRLYRSAK